MSGFARVYNQAFEKSPAGTLAVANGVLSAVADVVAQGVQIGMAYQESKKPVSVVKSATTPTSMQHVPIPKYDPLRTVRFLAFGTMMGPLLARWNHFLEVKFPLRPLSSSSLARTLPTSVGGKPITASGAVGRATENPVERVSLAALAKRVGCDQGVMAPLGLAIFLGSMGVMEGHSLNAIKYKYVELYPPAIKANWMVWPVIQMVNFRFMPLPYRVPFQATCGVFWTLYLSLLNSRKPVEVGAAVEDLREHANHVADKLAEVPERSAGN